MTAAGPIKLVPKGDTESLLEFLNDLHTRVVTGEICELLVVAARPDRTFFSTGSGCVSVLEQVGMLVTLIVDRLKVTER